MDPNLSSPYIDHTEYYLNNILKRQGAMPVWIDRQGSVHARTREFRDEVGRSWLTHAVHVITQAHPGAGDGKARAQLIAQIRAAFKTHAATTGAWKATHAGFHAAAVRDLNSAIRSYNLQAPGAARRGYLDVTRSLRRVLRPCSRSLMLQWTSTCMAPLRPWRPRRAPRRIRSWAGINSRLVNCRRYAVFLSGHSWQQCSPACDGAAAGKGAHEKLV